MVNTLEGDIIFLEGKLTVTEREFVNFWKKKQMT